MKVLNKTISEPFASFYEGIVTQIGEPKFRITQTPGLGECHFEQGIPVISLRMDLNRSDFEHHTAHELIHALQYKEGWPRAVSRYPYNHPINELGMTLLAMVLDLDVEDRISTELNVGEDRKNALQQWKDYIKVETRSKKLTFTGKPSGKLVKKWKIDELEAEIGISK